MWVRLRAAAGGMEKVQTLGYRRTATGQRVATEAVP